MPLFNIRQARDEAVEILRLAGLSAKASQPASTLGLVDRRRLEIARALATKPKLLLLDEMFAGLNTAEVDGGIELVKTIKASGISLIVVEHVMKVIMGISDRVVVLKVGAKIADCLPHEISSNAHIVEAYLGKQTVCSK
jgi:branched-chain amino acid transport system ATP-binding protein